MSNDPVFEPVLDLISGTDPDVAALVRSEAERQHGTIELIASENHVSPAVQHTMGTCLTNKYAEGYPGARYYGGCEHHDRIEDLARDRAKELFGCSHANVQPHSGATANASLFLALLKPGDVFASLELSDGGHLSHGLKVNVSGKWFSPVHYPLHHDPEHPEFERIDYDAVAKVCEEAKPKLIMCGYSAYPRTIDFERFRRIADDCGALLHADIAHIAGLVATGAHPSPFPHCHVVTTTTHKTLRGPRGGLILCDDAKLGRKIDRAVFPGMQGGPLMHVIAAKAVAFKEALSPSFKEYIDDVVTNAQALATGLGSRGFRITSGGTDNHLMLVDLRGKREGLTGLDAEAWLEKAGIVTNKNGIPNDPLPPKTTSGLRLGTPAATTRGFGTGEMDQIADWISRVVDAGGSDDVCSTVRGELRSLCDRFPIWG